MVEKKAFRTDVQVVGGDYLANLDWANLTFDKSKECDFSNGSIDIETAVEANADTIEEMIAQMYAPMERKGGFTPDWLITYIQNLTMPYFVLIIKQEERLKGILEQVRYAKTHILPKLYVENDHDLRLALEA
ncbi:MAG: hypothetical protein R3Y47_05920 [Lachnospiraceae bacterium]